MANGANSYVTNATFTNGEITLTIRVDDFGSSGGYVEITGQATQTGGAIAPYSMVVPVPAKPNAGPDADDPPGTEHYEVTVTATPMKAYQFWEDEEITVVTRVARVWLTVLESPSQQSGQVGQTGSSQSAGNGTTWNYTKKVAQVTDGSGSGWGSGSGSGSGSSSGSGPGSAPAANAS
jgi:hypothetical protein